MFENLEQGYLRQLNNSLAFVSQLASEINRNKTASYKDKLEALQRVQAEVNAAKRAIMFLMNTGDRK